MKKALVLLHGWGSGPDIFDELRCVLASRYDVTAPALPGYAAAPMPNTYTVEALALRVADAAPERCCVAGWSLGGQVALTWARAAPGQLERVALIATTPAFVQRHDWDAAVAADQLDAFRGELERDTRGTLTRFCALQAQGDEAAGRVYARLKRPLDERVPELATLRAGLELLSITDLRGDLRSVRQPTMVLHGRRDAIAPLAAGEYLARTLPDARLITLLHSAHAPFISDVKQVARSLMEFFG